MFLYFLQYKSIQHLSSSFNLTRQGTTFTNKIFAIFFRTFSTPQQRNVANNTTVLCLSYKLIEQNPPKLIIR